MWHIAGMGEFHTGIWCGARERKRPIGRTRRRGEGNIEVDIQLVGRGGIYWIHVVKDRDEWRALVSEAINLGDSKNSWEFLD
jgi:hypothetical protein